MQWLDNPCEDDISRLGRVAARAFENDMGNFLYYGGIRHSQHPEISEAVFRAWIRRSLVGGGRITTNADRTCMRIMYPPGSIDRSHDRSLDSATDPDWKTLEQYTDMEALWARYKVISGALGGVLHERYGDHPEQVVWRSSMTVVDPSEQGKGLGRVMNRFILDEVRKSGILWGHACLGHTLRFYERSGMYVVGPVFNVESLVDERWVGARTEKSRTTVWWLESEMPKGGQ